MMAKYLAMTIMITVAVATTGCKKKEEHTAFPPGHPNAGPAINPAGEAPDVPKMERSLDIPKPVKEKRGSVKLVLTEKRTKRAEEHVIPVESTLKVPNTRMTIRVLAYLPDFTMNDTTFTSASVKPNNPAAQVVISEPGRDDWKGWLYTLHPDVHPVEHEKLNIARIGGVER